MPLRAALACVSVHGSPAATAAGAVTYLLLQPHGQPREPDGAHGVHSVQQWTSQVQEVGHSWLLGCWHSCPSQGSKDPRIFCTARNVRTCQHASAGFTEPAHTWPNSQQGVWEHLLKVDAPQGQAKLQDLQALRVSQLPQGLKRLPARLASTYLEVNACLQRHEGTQVVHGEAQSLIVLHHHNRVTRACRARLRKR